METDALDGGMQLGDRYVLGDLVGRGGMADVYRARDPVLGRTVAVKMMRAVAVNDEDRARFTDEARMLARLSHPGLVTVLDAATSDDEPYLVMEFVDGPSLAERCRDGALEPDRVATIGAELADALGHVHRAGIVHRDLKPANVLLGMDGRARLTDFGLARIMSAALRHTTTGATVGTPAYLAPEQVRGDEITPAVDVYSLGLVLLEALTGVCPYQGLPVEAALARLTTPPAIPDTLPRQWHVLLRAMTALDPADRPSTAEVADALRDLTSGSASTTAPLRRFVADRWHLAVGVTVGVLLMALTGAWYGGDADKDLPPSPGSAQQRSGGVIYDARGPRLALHSARRRSAPDAAVPIASRVRQDADALRGVAQADVAQASDTAVPSSEAPSADRSLTASDDELAGGDTEPEATDATEPPASGDDDSDTTAYDEDPKPGNGYGNAYGVGNGNGVAAPRDD